MSRASPTPAPPASAEQALTQAQQALAEDRLHEVSGLAGHAWQHGSGALRAEAGYLLCMADYRLGRWASVLALVPQALPLLQGPEHAGRRIELQRWVTLSACETSRFDIALQAAQESCRLAQASGDPVQTGLSLVALAACFERMGDPWQSHRLMEEALALALQADHPYAHCVIRNNLCAGYIGAFYLLRDVQPEEAARVMAEAETHAREALALLPRLPYSAHIAVVLEGNLAETLVHRGLLDEAEPVLAAALARVEGADNAARSWRVRYTQGELLLARGQAPAAAQCLKTLLAELRGSEHINTLTRVHEALHRAWRAQGDEAQALAHLECFVRLERQRVAAQLKAQSELFITRMEAERARTELQAERQRAAQAEAAARRDQLTGLGNRRHLELQGRGLVARAATQQQPLALAIVDLDHFKHVNDAHGHAVGDQVLVRVARLLEAHTRASDVLVRLGGEEFLILLADAPPRHAVEVCERLRSEAAAHDWGAVAHGLALTLSIGLAFAPPYELDELQQAADAALYRAKRGGRNRVES